MIDLRRFKRWSSGILAVALPLLLSSCFTGIESTKTITPGREDRRQIAPTEEETILSGISFPVLKNWPTDKAFIVADQRLGYILESTEILPSELSLKDSLLYFKGVSPRMMPDAKNQAILQFELKSNPPHTILLPSGREYDQALATYTSLQLPMLIDPELIAQAQDILVGKDVYTLSPLWYDEAGNRIPGLKYTQVHIDKVLPGNAQFPLCVVFHTADGEIASMYMNIGNSGYDSRQFANLFSLTDLRKKYPSISNSVWENICHCRVALGMTKEECRLALGTPADVNSGHTYSETLDIWQYPDGKYLRFADGVLIDYRN